MPLPLTVQDSFQRTVTFTRYPERIVSLAPGHTEILFRLGVGERVVGVTEYCDFPPAARSKPKIGGFATPEVEKVISLAPQLVLATGIQKKIVQELTRVGIPVLALEPRRLRQVLEVITLIGQVTGTVAVAGQVRAEMEARITTITSYLRRGMTRRPRVYFVCPYPQLTAGSASLTHDLMELAGGENIAGDHPGTYVEFPFSLVRERDPEVLLFAYGEVLREYLLGSPEWAEITAVKEGRLFLLDKGLVNHPGPRLVDGLEQMARALHPECFDQA